MRTKAKTTKDAYREAFDLALVALGQIDVLLEDHGDRHDALDLTDERVLTIEEVAHLLEAAVNRLLRDLPA